jgi:hypothetical protein
MNLHKFHTPNRRLMNCVLAVIFLLTACTAAKTTPTPTPVPPTATPIPPTNTPIPPTATVKPTVSPPPADGSYIAYVTKDDFKKTVLTDSEKCEQIGAYTLTVAGERWFIHQDAAPECTVPWPEWSGSWEFAGDKVTFQDDLGPTPNTYQWRFDGVELSFTKVQDGNPFRSLWLASHPWVKQASPMSIPLQFQALDLWEDATQSTIGTTGEWTNKVELADINGDGLVDILFANGGNYDTPGNPVFSQIFLNQSAGNKFKEVTETVFGTTKMLARVIKVRDVNGDGFPDILVGTTYQTQSRLYLGDGSGGFSDVTATHLPQIEASIGDLEFGDVDGDGDLDVVLTDWGLLPFSSNPGGRTMLWLNDGFGHFSDATAAQMPDILVKFSWEIEFVDVDNDYDLDILISSRNLMGSFLFENDGKGNFSDGTAGRLPSTKPYDFETMDLNGDGYLDVIAINVDYAGSLVFINNQHGGFEDATSQLWSDYMANLGGDDNMAAFLDYDSDGDADFIIGSLTGPDRLLINDGSGRLIMNAQVFTGENTPGTLYLAVADLNGDHKLDVVMAQGENLVAMDDRVFLGANIQPDTAPPVITLVEQVAAPEAGQTIQIRARVHDNKSPTMPQDWQSVTLKWTAGEQTGEVPMQWYGEYLWRAVIDDGGPRPEAGKMSYQVCATDAAGNQACSEMVDVEVK